MFIQPEEMETSTTEASTASALSFAEKQKMLFESLTSAAECIKGTTLEQTKETEKLESRKRLSVSPHNPPVNSKKFQGKESIFKKPELSITKCLKPRRSPDYQVCI